MKTLILTRSEIVALLEASLLLCALRDAFRAYSTERTVDAIRVPVPLPQSAAPQGASGMLLAPGLVPGIPAYSVKVHAKFPGENPAISGVIVLHDLTTGKPLALLESSYLTALRTAMAGALAVDILALPEATRVAIIGAGAQGRSQLQALRMVRPIRSVRVLDPSSTARSLFIADACCEGLDVTIASSLEEALEDAEIVVTATWARDPFLFRKHLKVGMHINTFGPDQPGKCELAADVLTGSVVIVDDRGLAVEMGSVGGAGLDGDVIHAELGEVIAGIKPGRLDRSSVTVFGSVGLPFQDLAAAWLVYCLANKRESTRSIDLLS
jgi:ornithine cyclodeaminase/alanine dehydrogenase-like protein (mu-crystallin family)